MRGCADQGNNHWVWSSTASDTNGAKASIPENSSISGTVLNRLEFLRLGLGRESSDTHPRLSSFPEKSESGGKRQIRDNPTIHEVSKSRTRRLLFMDINSGVKGNRIGKAMNRKESKNSKLRSIHRMNQSTGNF